MSASQNDTLPPRSGRRPAGEDAEAALAMPIAEPHGYDPVEFGPDESRRDFPARRGRAVDEERRLLKEAQAAFEGPEKRHDLDDGPAVDAAGPAPDDDMERPSRLYRD